MFYNEPMHILLLSGGSGKRLWPLSNEIRSKQFIKIFRAPDGADEPYESMVQRMYRQIKEADPAADITIGTSRSQVSALHNQLGEDVSLCVEPCRRDTFPAILLDCAYMTDVLGISAEEPVIICPVDPYVDTDFFVKMQDLENAVLQTKANLVLMGITPTYPSEKYGYILLDKNKENVVTAYREKPDAKTAESFITQGALWNSGVYACKLSYIRKQAQAQTGFASYEDLLKNYENLPKISFDYAVAEKEPDMLAFPFSGKWKDLGTWNTLTEAMEEDTVGSAMMNENCENVHIINEMDVPVLAMGLKDTVISASPEGILVADKEQSSYIKPFVDQIDQQIMFAEKSWGSFRVLDVEPESLTIKVILMPGHRMNYHSHAHRDEVWTVVEGEGLAVIDGAFQKVSPGDVLTMKAGSRHAIYAYTELKVIEVQYGIDISVQDKEKYEWPETDLI